MIDAFVDPLDLAKLWFEGVETAESGPACLSSLGSFEALFHGYLNRVQSSRRLGREVARNVELMRLLGRLGLDHKTAAEF